MQITAAQSFEPAAVYEVEDHSARDEHDHVYEPAGGRWRWCRARPRRAAILAVTGGIVLLATACGSGSSAGSAGSSTPAASSNASGSSNTAASTQAQQNLAFAQCMRSHGVTDFPDPGSDGQLRTISVQMENGPHFAAGFDACKHLLPDGGVSKAQQDQAQLLKFAQCMHAHGVPSYPESGPVGPYSVIGPNTAVNALKVAGVNPNSPVVQAAVRTCERENPVGS